MADPVATFLEDVVKVFDEITNHLKVGNTTDAQQKVNDARNAAVEAQAAHAANTAAPAEPVVVDPPAENPPA